MTSVSVPTITAIERGGNVHFENLVAVAVVLGAGLILSPVGSATSFWSGAAVASGHQGWTTPPGLLAKLYDVVGGPFDLDPCSPTSDRRTAPVQARVHFTESDDGLLLDWFGRVYCNPPYGRDIGRWVRKCRNEVESQQAKMVISLLPARSDTSWWHQNVAGRADTIMLKGRLAFGGSGQPAPFPSALACWGMDREIRQRMREAFPDAWFVAAVPAEEKTA
jgi:hypothetical protein